MILLVFLLVCVLGREGRIGNSNEYFKVYEDVRVFEQEFSIDLKDGENQRDQGKEIMQLSFMIYLVFLFELYLQWRRSYVMWESGFSLVRMMCFVLWIQMIKGLVGLYMKKFRYRGYVIGLRLNNQYVVELRFEFR